MPCWYYDKKALHETPSIQDGFDYDTEYKYRKEGAQLIIDIGAEMDLGYSTSATGVVFFHRFYMFHSFKTFNRFVTACCCIFLAGKVEETPKKCKDIIKVAKKLLSEENFLAFGIDAKEEVMTLESILLQTMKFDLKVQHPYSYLIKYAKCLKGDKNKLHKMVQMAWTFVNDSLCTTLSIQWEPEIIAIALMYLAGKLSKFKVISWGGRKNYHLMWWDLFVEDLSMDILEDICHQVLDLYSPVKNEKLETSSNVTQTNQVIEKSIQCQSSDYVTNHNLTLSRDPRLESLSVITNNRPQLMFPDSSKPASDEMQVSTSPSVSAQNTLVSSSTLILQNLLKYQKLLNTKSFNDYNKLINNKYLGESEYNTSINIQNTENSNVLSTDIQNFKYFNDDLISNQNISSSNNDLLKSSHNLNNFKNDLPANNSDSQNFNNFSLKHNLNTIHFNDESMYNQNIENRNNELPKDNQDVKNFKNILPANDTDVANFNSDLLVNNNLSKNGKVSKHFNNNLLNNVHSDSSTSNQNFNVENNSLLNTQKFKRFKSMDSFKINQDSNNYDCNCQKDRWNFNDLEVNSFLNNYNHDSNFNNNSLKKKQSFNYHKSPYARVQKRGFRQFHTHPKNTYLYHNNDNFQNDMTSNNFNDNFENMTFPNNSLNNFEKSPGYYKQRFYN